VSDTTHYLVVREIGTDKEVHRIDVREKTDSQIERIGNGLFMQMDTDKFYVDEEAATEKGARKK